MKDNVGWAGSKVVSGASMTAGVIATGANKAASGVAFVGEQAVEKGLRPAGPALLPQLIRQGQNPPPGGGAPFELDGHFLMFFLQACDYLGRCHHPGIFRVPCVEEAVLNESHVSAVMEQAAAQEPLGVSFFEHRPLVLAMVVATVLDCLAHPLLPTTSVDILLARGSREQGFEDADIEMIQRQVESRTRGIAGIGATCCHLALLKQVLSPISMLREAGCHGNAVDLGAIFAPHLARIEASPLTLNVIRPTFAAAIEALASKLGQGLAGSGPSPGVQARLYPGGGGGGGGAAAPAAGAESLL